MKMTLKEVCNHVGVTRRAVQGYEKAGLVRAIEKNKYGHLLYDEAAVERIREVKQYQDFGFAVKEIEVLLGVSREEYLEMMEERLKGMRMEMERMQENVGKLVRLIAME
jgi:DNA-binding transcriptional MerR regulator